MVRTYLTLILLSCISCASAELVSIESLFSKFGVTTLSELFSRSDRPIVLDVYGDGCPYCNALSYPFTKVAQDSGDRVYFASFNHNTSAGSQAKAMFHIQRIPYLIMVRDGSVVFSGVYTGGSNEGAFRRLVNSTLGLSL